VGGKRPFERPFAEALPNLLQKLQEPAAVEREVLVLEIDEPDAVADNCRFDFGHDVGHRPQPVGKPVGAAHAAVRAAQRAAAAGDDHRAPPAVAAVVTPVQQLDGR
jgi:hypothetical protein